MINYKEKFEKMRIAGNLAARTLDMLTDNIKDCKFWFIFIKSDPACGTLNFF